MNSELQRRSRAPGAAAAPAALSDAVSGESPACEAGSARRTLAWPVRALLSGWILFHFTGIVVAPASIPPSSELVRSTWSLFGPYLQLMYLNHGYHYFAPDPGPSTLVEYTLTYDDGRIETGRIPSRKTRPRLLYHRTFMLTEFLASSDEDPQVQELLVRAMARQLVRSTGAREVSLTRLTHLLPSPQAVRAGRRLDDPAHYVAEPLGVFLREDF